MTKFYDIQSGYNVVQQRSNEIVTLDEVKEHLRITFNDEDSYIQGLIVTARAMCENHCNRSIVQQEILMVLDSFPDSGCGNDGVIYLKRSPVQEVLSVQYYDSDNALQTLNSDQYYLDLASRQARIVPVDSWPAVLEKPNAVHISYVAGVIENSDNSSFVPNLEVGQFVPPGLSHAVKLLVEHLYSNRSPVVSSAAPKEIPFSVTAILSPFILDRG